MWNDVYGCAWYDTPLSSGKPCDETSFGKKTNTRWAPTTHKWSYNPYKRPKMGNYRVISPYLVPLYIYIYIMSLFHPIYNCFLGPPCTSPKKNLSSLCLIDFSPNLRVRIFRDDGKSGSRRVETKNTESRGSVIFCWSEPVLECNTNLKWPKCNDKDRLELNVVYLSPKSLKFTLWISFRRSIFNFSHRFSLCFTHRFSPLDCSCNLCFLPIPVTTVAFFFGTATWATKGTLGCPDSVKDIIHDHL